MGITHGKLTSTAAKKKTNPFIRQFLLKQYKNKFRKTANKNVVRTFVVFILSMQIYMGNIFNGTSA